MTHTTIEWTDYVWNPVSGCTKVSQGCKFCYAEAMFKRFGNHWGHKFNEVTLVEKKLYDPLRIKNPKRIFVNSMSDLFHEDVPFSYIHKVFAVMDVAHWHTFQVLTKRADRMHDYMMARKSAGCSTPANIWLGVSCEDQETALERIQKLMDTPAAIRFLSCEPLLGPIDIGMAYSYRGFGKKCTSCTGSGHYHDNFNTPCPECNQTGINPNPIHWVICGGESGRNARPMHPDWVRSLRDQCQEQNVPFFFKQWGEWLPLEFDAQPPFRRFANNFNLIDGHHINVIDPEDPLGKPGTYGTLRFMDVMESMRWCMKWKENQCDFLKRGKVSFAPSIDGISHQNFPTI